MIIQAHDREEAKPSMIIADTSCIARLSGKHNDSDSAHRS